MSAAEVLAQHKTNRHSNGVDLWHECTCNDGVRYYDRDKHAQHQLDALKAAGYEVVELPDPDDKNNRPLWGVLVGGEPEDVYVRPSGEVVISGAAVLYDDESRRLGEVLLAANNATEATR